MRVFNRLLGLVVSCVPSMAFAAESLDQTQQVVRNTGVSAIWILANISYAGMRAQNHPSTGWRIVSFVFGFPGTFVTYLAVRAGNERAYGIELPRKNDGVKPTA